MMNTVGTVSTLHAALRAHPAATVSALVESSATAASFNRDFVASRIRVDNLQDVAILEYRNGEGEVVRQYPTEKQIEAFKRAQRLEEQSRAQTAQAQASTQRLEAALGQAAPASGAHETAAPADTGDGETSAATTTEVVV